MSKDIGVMVPLTPEVKAWVEAQAEDIGLNAANAGVWIRMLVHQAWKRGQRIAATTAHEVPFPDLLQPQVMALGDAARMAQSIARQSNPDAWRGPVEEDEPPTDPADVEALVASRLAEAEAAGLTQSLEQASMAPTAAAGNVRALVRPPPRFSPSAQPSWG